MLTYAGHGIILRSILGTLPSAVTHMSFGINFNDGSTSLANVERREQMGFEVLRVPIQTSYDHLTPLDTASTRKEDYQLMYKGEIPINKRILFNEVGLWLGSSNSRYGDNDSKLLSNCDVNSGWRKITTLNNVATEIIATPSDFYPSVREEYYLNKAFRMAQPRIESHALILKRSTTTEIYKYKLPMNVDLSSYSSNDVFKYAFTWTPGVTPTSFISQTQTVSVNHYVNVQLIFEKYTLPYSINLQFTTRWENNKSGMKSYVVRAHLLSGMVRPEFGRLKHMVITNNTASAPAGSSLLLDGVRIDRVRTNNPLYGLVFYDQVFDEVFSDNLIYQLPLEKLSGFDGHMEHRVRLFANSTGEVSV